MLQYICWVLWHKGSPLGVSDSSDSKLPTPRRMFWWVILLDPSDPGILYLASLSLPAPSRAEWGVWGPARLHHLWTTGPGLPDSQSCILPRAPDRLAFTQQRWKMTDHRPAPPTMLPTEAMPSQSPGGTGVGSAASCLWVSAQQANQKEVGMPGEWTKPFAQQKCLRKREPGGEDGGASTLCWIFEKWMNVTQFSTQNCSTKDTPVYLWGVRVNEEP